MAQALTEQIISQVKAQVEDLQRLKYGEINLIVQDGRLVRMDLRKQIRVGTDPKNGRSGQ